MTANATSPPKTAGVADRLPQTLRWDGTHLYLLDQTQLPIDTVVEQQESLDRVWDSIKQLKVRGAPAIGIAGAYGLLVGLRSQTSLSMADFLAELDRQAAYLNSARPTAVNLSWALKRMAATARKHEGLETAELYRVLEREAIQIHDEDRQLCRGIGEAGVPLIRQGMGVLTHCNAGSLATSEWGTALAPMYLACDRGIQFKVYADETRPLLQGSRLTAWELQQAGVDVTVICDNMAASLMARGAIDIVIVGTDRVAANGDVANKIGTLGVAILAQYFQIPFYVACPYSTIDFATPSGEAIVIEERRPEEVTHFGLRRTAPEAIAVCNPAFDVTPHALVTGLITEKGILRPPYKETLKASYETPAL